MAIPGPVPQHKTFFDAFFADLDIVDFRDPTRLFFDDHVNGMRRALQKYMLNNSKYTRHMVLPSQDDT